MNSFINIPLSVVIPILSIYLAFILILGLSFYKKMEDADDFLLAGKKMSPWLIGASAFATNISGATLLGFGGTGYSLGIGGYWLYCGFGMGGWFIGVFLAGLLRKMNVYTLPEVVDRFVGTKRSRVLTMLLVSCRDFALLASQVISLGPYLNSL